VFDRPRRTEQQLPFRFLIASRPESHIREIFTDALNNIHCPLNVEQSFEDVRRYLLNEFARIHREHHATMARVPYPWPTPEIVDNLVHNSSGYFIYMSTIIKFMDDKKFRPTERLVIINEPLLESPFASLDRLYTQILSQVHARPQLLKILTVIAAEMELPVAHVEQLLELEEGDVRLALCGLHSVISGLEGDSSDDWPFNWCLHFHHASFRDFLQDPGRAGIFYIGGCSHRTDLSHHILKAFSYRHQYPSQNRRDHVSG
jgi:hypothetical protein